MKFFALTLIRAYQRYVSPRKGFCCSYRAHTGGPSCSALGHRAIRMKGVMGGIAILKERLFLCGVVHRRFGKKQSRPPKAQRGDCDFGCVDLPCDGDCGSGGSGKSNICEAARCLENLACDWPASKKKGRKGKPEREVHIPPRANSTD